MKDDNRILPAFHLLDPHRASIPALFLASYPISNRQESSHKHTLASCVASCCAESTACRPQKSRFDSRIDNDS